MPFLHYNKKLLILIVLFVLLWICFYSEPSYNFSSIFIYFYKSNSIKCYRYKGETLPEISSVDVRQGKSIFFHETSCNSYINGKIVIAAREACAVESAALLHPNLDVYLLFTSPGVFKFEGTESDRFLKSLMSYENVKILHLDYEKYTKGTPLEDLYESGRIEASQYAMSHASDVLRYLTLWKYGGIYLDLDVVVIKNLESLPPNFSGCESMENVAAGVMGFESNSSGTGHNLAHECVMDLKDHFSGTIWGNNGPGVITRLVKKHCKVNKIKDAMGKVCNGFKIFPPQTFYPIPWPSWEQYFREKSLSKVMNATLNSYVIHVWNKHSSSLHLPLDSKSAYTMFAKKFCPKVYKECDAFF
ncbi:lactosylceramide 4-alpha-galactosyltransferase-like [Coccinella septempunctata]|uniref:lactosylceramide 4-alpha-galactosyltransferase-like n=1 Tax=Coccinella septempunctata TaxID=41139 RepID=UPI001D064F57|nr:lactosylceramide 4-alpha-galactosyltransferase-like [Coccinella septempunctata]